MARCGCSGSCSCYVTPGPNLAVDGSGTKEDPYVIRLTAGAGIAESTAELRYVRHDAPQVLGSTDQKIARTNIAAAQDPSTFVANSALYSGATATDPYVWRSYLLTRVIANPVSGPTIDGLLAYSTTKEDLEVSRSGAWLSMLMSRGNYAAGFQPTASSSSAYGWQSGSMVSSNNLGSMGTNATLDPATAVYHYGTLTTNLTVALTAPGTSGPMYRVEFEVTQAAAPRTITWPASVKWPGGTAPTLSAGSGKKDIFSFTTRDNGATWIGRVVGQNY